MVVAPSCMFLMTLDFVLYLLWNSLRVSVLVLVWSWSWGSVVVLNVAICFLNVHGLHLGWGGGMKRGLGWAFILVCIKYTKYHI